MSGNTQTGILPTGTVHIGVDKSRTGVGVLADTALLAVTCAADASQHEYVLEEPTTVNAGIVMNRPDLDVLDRTVLRVHDINHGVSCILDITMIDILGVLVTVGSVVSRVVCVAFMAGVVLVRNDTGLIGGDDGGVNAVVALTANTIAMNCNRGRATDNMVGLVARVVVLVVLVVVRDNIFVIPGVLVRTAALVGNDAAAILAFDQLVLLRFSRTGCGGVTAAALVLVFGANVTTATAFDLDTTSRYNCFFPVETSKSPSEHCFVVHRHSVSRNRRGL